MYVLRYYGKMVLMMNGQPMGPGKSYIWPVGGVIRNSLIGSKNQWLGYPRQQRTGQGRYRICSAG
jgi:hypothetical protein